MLILWSHYGTIMGWHTAIFYHHERGVFIMWVEISCTICGYRETTDHDTRTVQQIHTVCDGGCPNCGNTDQQNPYWFQYGPDGEMVDDTPTNDPKQVPTKFILIKWWPDTPTPEHQQRIDAK